MKWFTCNKNNSEFMPRFETFSTSRQYYVKFSAAAKDILLWNFPLQKFFWTADTRTKIYHLTLHGLKFRIISYVSILFFCTPGFPEGFFCTWQFIQGRQWISFAFGIRDSNKFTLESVESHCIFQYHFYVLSKVPREIG